MNLTLPADYELYHGYSKLLMRFSGDELKATYLFVSLWKDLAYQAQLYGRAGFFRTSERDAFQFRLQIPERDHAVALLVEAGILAPHSDGWFCEQFAEHNYHLDRSYRALAIDEYWRATFEKDKAKFQRQAPALSALLSPSAWHKEDKTLLTADEMHRCIVLVKNMDAILQLPARVPARFTAGLIQAATRVTARFSDEQIDAVLKRWYLRAREKHPHPNLPRDTDVGLAKFSEVSVLLMPDNGWENWVRRTDHETLDINTGSTLQADQRTG